MTIQDVVMGVLFGRSVFFMIVGAALLIDCIRNRHFSHWTLLLAFGSLGVVSSNAGVIVMARLGLFAMPQSLTGLDAAVLPMCVALESISFLTILGGVILLMRDMQHKLFVWQELSGMKTVGDPAFAGIRRQLRTWSEKRGDGNVAFRPRR